MNSDENQNIDSKAGTASVVDMHDPVKREKILLPAGHAAAGLSVLVVSAFVLILGGGQLFSNANGFSSSIYRTDFYRPEARPSLGGDDEGGADVPWIEDWMADGKKVYNNCVACHQPSGTGAPGQFPPLKGSEWVDGGTDRLAAIMLKGITGPFTVAGQSYNQQMPAWNALSDDKIAQVLTYVRREFGSLPEGEDGVVTTEMIKAARDQYSDHAGFWDEAGLRAIPEDKNLPGAKVDLNTGKPVGEGAPEGAAPAEGAETPAAQ